MNDTVIRGSCLCGTVTFEVRPPFQRMVHCHCSRCRHSSGTGHATNLMMAPEQLRWLSGEAAISRFDLPDATRFSKWFCSRCGSPVARISRGSGLAIVPAGSLEENAAVAPTDHIFWASRAAWDYANGELPTHDEYPKSWLA